MAYAGRYREAANEFRRAHSLALSAGFPEMADPYLLQEAALELQVGLTAKASATLHQLSKPQADSPQLVVEEAELGNLAAANRFLAIHQSDRATLVAHGDVPTVRAALKMRRGKPLDGIAALEPAAPYEMRDYTVPWMRAQAYLRASQPEQAVVEFLKITRSPGIDPASSLLPMAHLRLAEAYALQNRNAESRSEYETFLSLWRTADPDLPILQRSRLEYAKLIGGKQHR